MDKTMPKEDLSRVESQPSVAHGDLPRQATSQSVATAPENAEPFEDTPLKQAIRRAFDDPTRANIEAVATAAIK